MFNGRPVGYIRFADGGWRELLVRHRVLPLTLTQMLATETTIVGFRGELNESAYPLKLNMIANVLPNPLRYPSLVIDSLGLPSPKNALNKRQWTSKNGTVHIIGICDCPHGEPWLDSEFHPIHGPEYCHPPPIF